jgi:hypothetical protein
MGFFFLQITVRAESTYFLLFLNRFIAEMQDRYCCSATFLSMLFRKSGCHVIYAHSDLTIDFFSVYCM